MEEREVGMKWIGKRVRLLIPLVNFQSYLPTVFLELLGSYDAYSHSSPRWHKMFTDLVDNLCYVC